jgi:GrpB-like predicted nucleotidyltransferase (UPF0157 family)
MPFADESVLARPVPYRPEWALEFEALAAELTVALGSGRRPGPSGWRLDHVGSTAVPGMVAKDCVDVMIRADPGDFAEVADALGAVGFRLRPEPWNREETSFGVTAAKLVLAPPVGARPSNIHIRAEGSPNARYALLFRDFLRADQAARDAWSVFKSRLAVQVPELSGYGQIKAPATDILMAAATAWADRTGWAP